jgi:Ca-activated chloride channel family protein
MKTRLSLALLLALSFVLSLVGPAFADGIIIPDPPICRGGPCPPPPCLPIDQPPPVCNDCPPQPLFHCPPYQTPLRVKVHRVDVTIDQQVATTRIDQTFVNDATYQVEGTYIFPLPIDASVNDFAMWVDGQKIEAKILSADEARSIYNDIVARRRDPALLEYVGRGAVQASIFPIPPNGERRVEIEYSQVLAANNGLIHYVYPLNTEKFSARPLESVSVNVTIKSNDALKAIYSPSHNVLIKRDGDFAANASYEAANVTPDKDFELFYSVSPQDIGLNLITYKDTSQGDAEPGFFVLLAAPNVQVDATSSIVPKDVILVLDTSGSMEGEKIAQARNALKFVLDHLNAGDRFNIISFNSAIKSYSDRLHPVSEAANGKQFVDQLAAQGSTDINRALLEALASVDAERPTTLMVAPATIIFLTDGLPTSGVTEPAQIVANFKAATRKNVRLFTFGVGDDVNAILLDQLAQENRGVSAYVRPGQSIDEEVSAFYAKIATPVLADISIDLGSTVTTSDVYPQPLPDLFAGSQLVMVGRYTGSGPAAITLKGNVIDQAQTFTYEGSFTASGGADFIPRLWATRKIGYLLNQVRLYGENKEVIAQIVSLSVRYGIITPYTSFLVQENADVFTEEGRKALPTTAAPMMSAPAVGGAAVDAAQAQQEMRSADQAAPVDKATAPQVKIVGDKTFLFKNDVWIDTQFDPSQMQTTKIDFAGNEYFKLSASRLDAAAAFALGSHVIVVIDGRAYEVIDTGSNQPSAIPATPIVEPTDQPSIQNQPTPVVPTVPPSINTPPPAAKTSPAPTQCLGAAAGMMVMTLIAAGISRKKIKRR